MNGAMTRTPLRHRRLRSFFLLWVGCTVVLLLFVLLAPEPRTRHLSNRSEFLTLGLGLVVLSLPLAGALMLLLPFWSPKRSADGDAEPQGTATRQRLQHALPWAERVWR